MQHDGIEFPTVELVEGGMTIGRRSVLLQLSTAERGTIHFSLRAADLEAFVTFILRMAASRRASVPAQDRVNITDPALRRERR